MTREQFAEMIHWSWIIWSFGLLNVGAMLPQLIKILLTKKVEGLSLSMFSLYFLIQVAFAFEGFFTRNIMLRVCMGFSATVSVAIIGLVLYIRLTTEGSKS